jgi:hypothetical protein
MVSVGSIVCMLATRLYIMARYIVHYSESSSQIVHVCRLSVFLPQFEALNCHLW